MTNQEEQIWNLVHRWCDEQSAEIPDANRRALMDRIVGLINQSCKCPGCGEDMQGVTLTHYTCKWCGECYTT